MALLNAQLEVKQMCGRCALSCVFVTPQDGECNPFSTLIACSLMQDRPLFYAKTRVGSFLAHGVDGAFGGGIEPTKQEKIGCVGGWSIKITKIFMLLHYVKKMLLLAKNDCVI